MVSHGWLSSDIYGLLADLSLFILMVSILV